MSRRLLVYLLLTMAVVMAVRDARLVTWDNLDSHSIRADYIGIRLCITMAAEGNAIATKLYDLDLEKRTEAEIMGPISFADGILPCDYPPYTVLLALPLYNFSPGASFIIWDILEIAALLISLWLLKETLPSTYRYLLWLGAFAFLPIYHSLIEGQTSPALLLGVTLLWRGLRIGGTADWWAGAGLGFCLLKPQFLPLLLLYLIYKRNWKALSGFSAVAAIAYIGSALLSGFNWPTSYLKLISFFAAQSGHYGFYPEAMFNWRGLLARFALDSVPILVTLSILTIVALLYTWWRSDAPDKLNSSEAQVQFVTTARVSRLELQLAATVLAATLTNFHLYSHDLTVLLFSGAALLGWAAQQCWPPWLCGLLLSGPLASLLLVFGLPFYNILFLVMVAAFGVILSLLLQPRSELRLSSTI